MSTSTSSLLSIRAWIQLRGGKNGGFLARSDLSNDEQEEKNWTFPRGMYRTRNAMRCVPTAKTFPVCKKKKKT